MQKSLPFKTVVTVPARILCLKSAPAGNLLFDGHTVVDRSLHVSLDFVSCLVLLDSKFGALHSRSCTWAE